MAKTDNLTDFLTGLADKFRSKLGGTALINPQNFESKIDEVYQKGYDSAPQGVDTSDATAAADDVQNGKTFYAGGVKKTGSLNVTAGLVDSAVTVVDEPGNNQIYAQNAGISQKAIYNKNTKTKLLIPYNKVTSAIGLTAEKVASGNTILGVAGTAQTGVDTSDATATAADILLGKTAYVNGVKLTGTAQTGSSSTEPEYGYGEFTYTKYTDVEGCRIQVAKQPQFMAVSLDICDYSNLDNLPGSSGYPCVIRIRLDWNSGEAKMLYKTSNSSVCEETVLSDLCTYSNGVVMLSDLNTVSKNRYFALNVKYNYFIKY